MGQASRGSPTGAKTTDCFSASNGRRAAAATASASVDDPIDAKGNRRGGLSDLLHVRISIVSSIVAGINRASPHWGGSIKFKPKKRQQNTAAAAAVVPPPRHVLCCAVWTAARLLFPTWKSLAGQTLGPTASNEYFNRDAHMPSS